MKKKLLVVLGAGSSLECGMPSVSAIDGLMQDWSAHLAKERATPDYFDLPWKALATHLDQGLHGVRSKPDFEKALAELVALMHWVRPAPAGSAMRTLVAEGKMPAHIALPFAEAHGPTITLKMHASTLLARLAQHMRAKCAAADAFGPGIERWKRTLAVLRETFDVAIYNLNYDTVALTCWPDAPTGFNTDGLFDAPAFHCRSWNGLMHLHGSVHFSLRENLSEEIDWRGDLNGPFVDCDEGQSSDERSDGRDFPRTTLIAGGFKLDQLLLEPFNSYQSALVRDAYAADAILLGGYGFTDMHVNRALKNALMRRREQRPPVLVLDWADELTDPISFRHDRWAWVLMDVLYAPSQSYAAPGRKAPTPPSDLKSRQTCELSSVHRTAIWYGGFLAAADAVPRLSVWLAGGAGTLLAPP